MSPSPSVPAPFPSRCPVLIAGGGPCGLMLAIELGRRGVGAVLIDAKAATAFNPQANATQARTMEHYRRLGFADEVRAMGLPAEYPTDIAYFTRYAGYEIARFSLPSARQAKQAVSQLSGSWSTAELPHRVSQKYVELVLRRQAEAVPGNSINYGWRLQRFTDHGDHVEAHIEPTGGGTSHVVVADYLVGVDGARSGVRQALGLQLEGDAGAVRDFMGGRMQAIYLRVPGFYRDIPHPPAWMYVTFNRDRRAFMAAVDGKSEFAFHTQLRPHEQAGVSSDAEALQLFQAAVGKPIEAEVLSHLSWTAGYALVANGFQRGRVLLGGDASHLFTPAGGLGYNTAIDDAVNLGWKLAAVVKGKAAPTLLASYEAERRPLAIRNTGYARAFADSLGLIHAPAEIEDNSPAGEEARRVAGAHFNVHARTEFNIPGVTFGGRYDGSPIIVGDGTLPPPDAPNLYVPTATPGGRAPHLWLEDGRSLYDAFGFEWTLLRLGRRPPDGAGFLRAAAAAGLDLTVVHIESDEARDLYESDLVVIRPDQVVAWRARSAAFDAADILARAAGLGR